MPYAFEVSDRVRPQGLTLILVNSGAVGAAFNLRSAHGGEPRFYTVEAGKLLEDLAPADGRYDLTLNGPNGFVRGFRGETGPGGPEASARFDAKTGQLLVVLRNTGSTPLTLDVASSAYLQAAPRLHRLAPGADLVDVWDIRASQNWYDFCRATCAVKAPASNAVLRATGRTESRASAIPLLGRQS